MTDLGAFFSAVALVGLHWSMGSQVLCKHFPCEFATGPNFRGVHRWVGRSNMCQCLNLRGVLSTPNKRYELRQRCTSPHMQSNALVFICFHQHTSQWREVINFFIISLSSFWPFKNWTDQDRPGGRGATGYSVPNLATEATYLNYCRSLRFEDRPDYAYLRRLLKDLFFREGYQ